MHSDRSDASVARVTGPYHDSWTISLGGGVFDPVHRVLVVRGKTIRLSPLQNDALFHIVRNGNLAFSLDQLATEVWGRARGAETAVCRQVVSGLRAKLRECTRKTPNAPGGASVMVMPVLRWGVSCCMALPLTFAFGQRPGETHLSSPDYRSPIEFSAIIGFREISSSAALMVDGNSGAVLRIDTKSGRIDTVGRRGSRPGEYQVPDRLVAMPAGATLLADLGALRLWRLGPDGRPRDSFPMIIGTGSDQLVVVPEAADADGRVYFGVDRRGAHGSRLVLRVDLQRLRVDTVAAVKWRDRAMPPPQAGSGGTASPREVAFSPSDAWAVTQNGRVVVARATGPRLEWITAGGRVARGPIIIWSPPRVSDADKSEFVKRVANDALLVMGESRDGVRTTRVRRGFAAVGFSPVPSSLFVWPDRKAPFGPDDLHISGAGEAWLELAVGAGEPRVVDVFGPNTRWRRRIVLPAGRSIVGFGEGTVYLKAVSETGKFTLERYRL